MIFDVGAVEDGVDEVVVLGGALADGDGARSLDALLLGAAAFADAPSNPSKLPARPDLRRDGGDGEGVLLSGLQRWRRCANCGHC